MTVRALAAGLGLCFALVSSDGGRAQEPLAPVAPGPPRPAPLLIQRTAGPIVVDGDVSDAGWQGAASIDAFYETSPGDNLPAKVRTVAWFAYDERYLYIGIQADDPEPARIRAPFVDRDQVFGTDDNIAVFIDPRNDRRSAFEFRVNPRGIQGDAIFTEATGNEDFSPDFFYDTAARITATGWNAEYRIPFSSLRYPDSEPQTWGIRVWRNYPRDFRYGFYSSPQARGSNCYVCHLHELTGFAGLPNSKHLVVAPYASARAESNRDPFAADPEWEAEDPEGDLGVDVKWNPTPSSAIDLTINPDFSQIESDVPQIEANERFSLFFPEKRPFFLEGVDLFETPIQAVYTRTLTAPRWGLRATGKRGASSYSLLVAEDRGGGLVILPGPTSNDFALQNFKSTVALGRVRRDFGASFGGLLFTARDVEGGGHNAVVGPDFQWRPNEEDAVTGQFLLSDTEDPARPDLGFVGLDETAHAVDLSWRHNDRHQSWRVRARDVHENFRADTGFVTAAGYRDLLANYGRNWYPEGTLRFVNAYVGGTLRRDRDNEDLGPLSYIGVFFSGRKNLAGEFDLNDEEIRVGSKLLSQTYLYYFLQIDPSRRIKRLGINGTVGEAIDFAGGRVGDGVTINFAATLNPTVHLEMQINAGRRWLDLGGRDGGRLFTATVERLRANYVFSSRQLVRFIGQYSETERDPALHPFPVARRDGEFAGSLLYSFKLNWQTVLFLGIGDERLLDERENLEGTRRTAFLKISYAIQR